MRPHEVRRERWRRVLLVAVLLAGIALIYLVFNVSRFSLLGDANAMDYAQIARHVLRGEGFTTSFIKPLSLVFHRSVENHPDLTYPPGHILWTAAIMRVLGTTDRAVSHSSGLAFVLTMPLVFWLAYVMFDWRTALLATALCGTHITLLGYAISGTESSLLGLLVTALLLVLYMAARTEGSEMPWVIAAGLLMGLAYMTKYVWLVAALPIVVYLARLRPQRRLARVALFVALTGAVASPWLYRNWRVVGNPFFTLRAFEMRGQTRSHPANTIYRTFRDHYDTYLVFAGQNPRAVFEKLRQGFSVFYASFHGLAGVFVTPFFIVGVLVRLGSDAVERLRRLLYGMLVVVALALTMLIAAPRLLAPLSPVMIILATVFFWRLLDARLQGLDERARGRWTALAVALLIVLHAHPFVTEITPDEPTAPAAETPAETAMRQLAQAVDGPVLTDAPWTVAWRADVIAIWVPQSAIDFRKMEAAVGRFRWLLLTPDLPRMAAQERLNWWADAWGRGLQGPVEHLGFVVRSGLADGTWELWEREAER
ncbi:MAG: ArnT family glycosyltransferase [Armatimonadota bacterium]